MNYRLRPITEDELHAIIPAKYWTPFQKLDNADQCFLIANPDQCESVAMRGFTQARIRAEREAARAHVAELAKSKRDAGLAWAGVIAEIKAETGQSPCESTLRRMVAEL